MHEDLYLGRDPAGCTAVVKRRGLLLVYEAAGERGLVRGGLLRGLLPRWVVPSTFSCGTIRDFFQGLVRHVADELRHRVPIGGGDTTDTTGMDREGLGLRPLPFRGHHCLPARQHAPRRDLPFRCVHRTAGAAGAASDLNTGAGATAGLYA